MVKPTALNTYRTEDGPLSFVWVPEAPKHAGVYAVNPKKKLIETQNCTHNIHDALQFKTKSECETWCMIFPEPVFVPREHGFGP